MPKNFIQIGLEEAKLVYADEMRRNRANAVQRPTVRSGDGVFAAVTSVRSGDGVFASLPGSERSALPRKKPWPHSKEKMESDGPQFYMGAKRRRFTISGIKALAPKLNVIGQIRSWTFHDLWDALGYVFLKRTRERVWIHVVEEMKIDYADALQCHQTFGWRLWLRVCFSIQTLALLLQTSKVAALGIIWAFIPQSAKVWIEHFFRTP